MGKIKCPNCGKEFEIDDKDYENIVSQIKSNFVDNEKKLLEDELKNRYNLELELLKTKLQKDLDDNIKNKDIKIRELENIVSKLNEEKDKDIKIATIDKDEIIYDLQKELEKIQLENKLKINDIQNEVIKDLSNKNNEIENLKNKIELNNSNFELEKQSLKNSFEDKLKEKNELIDYYKDLKTKLSTKLLGETLEQHCEIEFNKLRATGFQNSYFEKDNDAKTGSKGDYIFRDYTEDGEELVSIMFEMKNEDDKTQSKHKNEHFFKELDKDRNEKKCEYAVLVSMLESDSELYNSGIVDVSYKYDKMYVIRPQFFIPMITLIRNLSLKSLGYKKELNLIKNQNIDIANFEESLNDAKDKFFRNYQLAENKFKLAIDEIDKTIIRLQKAKEDLLSSGNNLRLANNKLEDLSIKKLTKNNSTMIQKFNEVEKNKKTK